MDIDHMLVAAGGTWQTVPAPAVALALAAAGELEGWQRWRADQLREALVAQAEGLLQRPAGQAVGGRKIDRKSTRLNSSHT
mgnify:CR=1 FL=1